MNISKQLQDELVHILKMKKLLGIEHIDSINFTQKKQSKNLLPTAMPILEEHVENCSLCELYKSKISSGFGIGDFTKDVYIVGLDYRFELEKEFMMIKNMCEKVLELNINEIYMTNIIKCGTNKNSQNLNDEIDICIDYIEQQINIAKPKFVITLGDAFKYIMKNNDDITEISGGKFSYNNITVLPLIDPVYISKNPSYKQKMYTDLKKLKTIMEEI